MKLAHLIATAAAVAGLSLSGLSASAGPVAGDAAILKGQAGSNATLVFGPPPPHFGGFHGGGFHGGGFHGGGLHGGSVHGGHWGGGSGHGSYGHYGNYGHSGGYGHSSGYGHYGSYGYSHYGNGYGRRGYWRDGRWYYAYESAAAVASSYGGSCYSYCRSAGHSQYYCDYHASDYCN